MAMALGRTMFIDLKQSTTTAPLDCIIPPDRLKHVPVSRKETEAPTPLTERIYRLEVTRRFREIRELESQGSLPSTPEKVRELHHFIETFRKNLPDYYRVKDPDRSWDDKCPFLQTHRELMVFLTESFLMALHRPYVFTREKSQKQVYTSALAILDSQDRLWDVTRTTQTQFFIGLTFPTFDAAVLLAVVLVSNPERYHETFQRPFKTLQNAFVRLSEIGTVFGLAKTGAEILDTTIRRVVDADRSVGGGISLDPQFFPTIRTPQTTSPSDSSQAISSSVSPSSEPWHFEPNPSAMEWTTQMQNSEFMDFDFSNLEVPMPLKELLLDEEMAAPMTGFETYDSAAYWMPEMQLDQQGPGMVGLQGEELQTGVSEVADNSLWNFLAGYDGAGENNV
jgi:hypothetical protein